MLLFFFFFFQAEDGIRDKLVTGVQTCALPISLSWRAWSKAPAQGAGDAVARQRIGEQLARLLLGEEVADVQPPASPLEREARVAIRIAGGRQPTRARAARAVVPGACGDEQPLTDQPLPARLGDPRRAAAEAPVVPVAHRIRNHGGRQRPAVEPGEHGRQLLEVIGNLPRRAREIVAARAEGPGPGAAQLEAVAEGDL